MSKKLFVGNLPWRLTGDDLFDIFNSIGPVENSWITKDKITGKPKGFGFVIMANDEDADIAIARLHGESLGGRDIVVNAAIERS